MKREQLDSLQRYRLHVGELSGEMMPDPDGDWYYRPYVLALVDKKSITGNAFMDLELKFNKEIADLTKQLAEALEANKLLTTGNQQMVENCRDWRERLATTQKVADEFCRLYNEAKQSPIFGEGYRLLNVGEMVIETDEFFHTPTGEWKLWGRGGEVIKSLLPIRRRTTSPWRCTKTDPPKKEDGDGEGYVLFARKGGESYSAHFAYKWMCPCDYWMPIPPLPAPKRDFQKDFLDPKKGTAAEQLWEILDEDMRAAIIKTWEDKS